MRLAKRILLRMLLAIFAVVLPGLSSEGQAVTKTLAGCVLEFYESFGVQQNRAVAFRLHSSPQHFSVGVDYIHKDTGKAIWLTLPQYDAWNQIMDKLNLSMTTGAQIEMRWEENVPPLARDGEVWRLILRPQTPCQ